MEKTRVIQPHEIKWEPHPQLANAKVAYLLSKREEKVDLTCFLVHLPVGTEVERHIHENSDDIIYVIICNKRKGEIVGRSSRGCTDG
jgi:quercetin dioxygenase-like cupin family protein